MSALNGEIITCDQHAGAPLQLRIYGDEFYARRENLEGYTVVYDSSLGCYSYATLAAGHFVSTGIPVYKMAPASLRRHLKEDPVVRNDKFGRRYARIRPPEDTADLGLMRTLGPEGGLLDGRKLHRGRVRGLTVIVDFDDIRTGIEVADVDALFNADDYRENGNHCSVKSYFHRVSSGKLAYTNLVVGPVRLSRRRSFYISNLLVKEAMDLVVNGLQIDLRQFDSRGEGIVDAINFLYAGESQYDGELWPHNSFHDLQYGAVRSHYYQLTGLGLHKVDLRIGTICHENGHLLCRFPDMYDYGRRDGDHEKSQGIGRYCLMGSGNHLDERRTPSPVCGYLRLLAGWVDTVVDLNTPGRYRARQGDYSTVFKFSTDKANEYFIVENRSRLGLDGHLPASGLAVLHCDTLGSNEWQQGTRNQHYQCALVQADGHLDLENNRNAGDAGDLFRQVPGVALANDTTPSSREWDDSDSGMVLASVSDAGAEMEFAVGGAQPENAVHAETSPNAVIPDNEPAGVTSALAIDARGALTAVSVSVGIIHSWISDLRVALLSPAGTRVILHNREGDDGDDIFRTWHSDDFVPLQALQAEAIHGDWRLEVVDRASQDVGRLLFWRLDLEFALAAGGVLETGVEPGIAIPDRNAAGVASRLNIDQAGQVRDLEIGIDIEHTYIGDLQVELVAPSGVSVLLHNREGDARDDIHRSYSPATTPALAVLVGTDIAGDWRLRVRDLAPVDTGRLNAWSLKIWF